MPQGIHGLYSLSGRASYRKIPWSRGARFGFRRLQSLWNLTGISAALSVKLQSDAVIIASNLAAAKILPSIRLVNPFSEAHGMMRSSNRNIFRVTGHLCGERGALVFSLICARIYGWVNNRKAGDLRRYSAGYDFTVMEWPQQNRVYNLCYELHITLCANGLCDLCLVLISSHMIRIYSVSNTKFYEIHLEVPPTE